MSSINEPSFWSDRDDDDGDEFLRRLVLDDEERRELIAQRRWRDSVLWLLQHASPEAWAEGVKRANEPQVKMPVNLRTGNLVPKQPAFNLIYWVQRSMPKRAATDAELRDLRMLIRATRDAQLHEEALRQAQSNPGWYLLMYQRLAKDLDVQPSDDGVI